MKLTPYLNFSGTCKAAFEFYAECFHGQIVAMFTHANTPISDQVGPEWQDLIMHARLITGDAVLMGSDAPPGAHEEAKGMWVSIHVEEPAEADRIFHALEVGGNVHMPIEETFWAHRFGMVVDRFGTPWMVNCEKPM